MHKDHYLCPWNTAVLYGDGHGNINTGCYYSCSIRKARLLSSKMLAAVLTRFKERMQAGSYDNAEVKNQTKYIMIKEGVSTGGCLLVTAALK